MIAGGAGAVSAVTGGADVVTGGAFAGSALVVVALMLTMGMAIVDVVNMIIVYNSEMTT